MDPLVWLALGVLVVAFLYSSVGHAGASGYIAVMSLLSFAPAEIRLAALVGGLAGSWLGARRLAPRGIKRLLAIVLAIAGAKLLLA